MSTLEKFFIGFSLVLLTIGIIFTYSNPDVWPLLMMPLASLSIYTATQIFRGQVTRKALAKGTVRVYLKDTTLRVEREQAFPQTKEDYYSLIWALEVLSGWLIDHQGQYPVAFYYRGYYKVLESKISLQSRKEEFYKKCIELN